MRYLLFRNQVVWIIHERRRDNERYDLDKPAERKELLEQIRAHGIDWLNERVNGEKVVVLRANCAPNEVRALATYQVGCRLLTQWKVIQLVRDNGECPSDNSTRSWVVDSPERLQAVLQPQDGWSDPLYFADADGDHLENVSFAYSLVLEDTL